MKIPHDWPPIGGPVDLDVHDRPHSSSSTEWWYCHTHLRAADGRRYGLFASFFITVVGHDKTTKRPVHAYSLTWAISDLEEQAYHTVSLVDRKAPEIGRTRIRNGELVQDRFLRKAAMEMLRKDVVPLPDEMFSGEVRVATDRLNLDYDGNTLVKQDDGSYVFDLRHDGKELAARLVFRPTSPVCLHGDDGVVAGVKAEDMFYYFIPGNDVTGQLHIGDETVDVEGSGWYDHEFGCHPDDAASRRRTKRRDIGWNWVAIQFDHGVQLTAYDLIDEDTSRRVGAYLIELDADGVRHQHDDFRFRPVGRPWTSTRTFNDYPVAWRLTCPSIDLDVRVTACFEKQEFGTVISKPAFWEGEMEVEGSFRGREVTGMAYVERSGFYRHETLEDFLKVVSRETLRSVAKILPERPGREKMEELVSRRGNDHLLRGMDRDVFVESVIHPIRAITDRGGKSWRSYATIACADIVGGDSQKAKDWLALPELMHVGSLMVDDVQDRSDTRRGGPTAHQLYGEPTAINAGTACYFFGQIAVYDADIDDGLKLEIYHLYFEALRAAHAGQALDITGLHHLMPEVVEKGTGRALMNRVLAIHRLKSAAPASYLARIGAMLGGGTDEQIDGLAHYFDALGMAFQIVDDTLNLKGFEDKLKDRGEDLAEGKVTFPVARAMTRLDRSGRDELWSILREHTSDPDRIGRAIELCDVDGNLDACDRYARRMMERAWKRLDPLVEDSMVKLNLRAFSHYLLDRQY